MSANANIHTGNDAYTPLFGYFYVEREGLETILVRVKSNNQWEFPINIKFNSCIQTAAEAVDVAIANFCRSSGLFGPTELLSTGLEPPNIHRVYIGPIPTEHRSPPKETVPALFFKIKLNNQSDDSSDYTWTTKETLFASSDRCVVKDLLAAINRDFIYNRFGFKVLECADMLVFRVKDNQVEFLLLKREDSRLEIVGWEYPKGGLVYHETVREGALRELKEETGVTTYIYRGYLGYQIVNVSDRKRIWYDTLRVHGLTFLYTGPEDAIRPSSGGEILRTPTWMSWEEARKKVWMKTYGPEFFDRWRAKQDEILEDLL